MKPAAPVTRMRMAVSWVRGLEAMINGDRRSAFRSPVPGYRQPSTFARGSARLTSNSTAPGLANARTPSAPSSTKRSWATASTRSEEHTSELQSLMRISYAVFCLKKKTQQPQTNKYYIHDTISTHNMTHIVLNHN